MMIALDSLSHPIDLNDKIVNTLCVENKMLYRNVIHALLTSNFEETKIVFSDNFIPFDFNKNVCFIHDYYNLDFSSAFVKKMYDDISKFCNSELQDEVNEFKVCYERIFDRIVQEYEYDLDYSDDFSLSNFFKACDLKPVIDSSSLLDGLQQFILLFNKYSKTKCFVLLNPHLYFSTDELEKLYSDLIYNHIVLLTIENEMNFVKCSCERITIIDNDFCEIVE